MRDAGQEVVSPTRGGVQAAVLFDRQDPMPDTVTQAGNDFRHVQ